MRALLVGALPPAAVWARQPGCSHCMPLMIMPVAAAPRLAALFPAASWRVSCAASGWRAGPWTNLGKPTGAGAVDCAALSDIGGLQLECRVPVASEHRDQWPEAGGPAGRRGPTSGGLLDRAASAGRHGGLPRSMGVESACHSLAVRLAGTRSLLTVTGIMIEVIRASGPVHEEHTADEGADREKRAGRRLRHGPRPRDWLSWVSCLTY